MEDPYMKLKAELVKDKQGGQKFVISSSELEKVRQVMKEGVAKGKVTGKDALEKINSLGYDELAAILTIFFNEHPPEKVVFGRERRYQNGKKEI